MTDQSTDEPTDDLQWSGANVKTTETETVSPLQKRMMVGRQIKPRYRLKQSGGKASTVGIVTENIDGNFESLTTERAFLDLVYIHLLVTFRH